ncbi:MAG: ferredoxin--NADP reductase, partial [Phycisphaeraceae bacterium]
AAPSGAKAAGGDTDPYNARIVGREDFTKDLALFKIAYEEAEVPDFIPGQFATLGVIQPETPEQAAKRRKPGPKLLRRAYSIASSPLEKNHLEFYIALVEEGQLTPKLWQLHEGDRLFMDHKIKGHFTMEDVPDGKDLIMVSTGTGLAPFLSMVDTYRGQPGRWNKLVFIHGVRLACDLGYRDKLEKLAAEDPDIFYIPAVTREPEDSDYDGPRGRCQTVLTQPILDQMGGGAKLDPEHAHVFLCGNPAMIDQCEVELTQLGFTVKDRKNPDGNVHFERYW